MTVLALQYRRPTLYFTLVPEKRAKYACFNV
jgi:hypothetical protein